MNNANKMEAGRGLDYHVAYRVLGLQPNNTEDGEVYIDRNFDFDYEICPHYSTDIKAAWEIVEKVCQQTKWYALCYRPTGAACDFLGTTRTEVLATFEECGGDREKAQALAICRAALALSETER